MAYIPFDYFVSWSGDGRTRAHYENCGKPGKKRWGKRFQQFRRDAPIGNPRDPLIGFPFAFTGLITENCFEDLASQSLILPVKVLFARRRQTRQIWNRFLHCNSIAERDRFPRDGGNVGAGHGEGSARRDKESPPAIFFSKPWQN